MRKFGDDRTAVLNTETEYKSIIREKGRLATPPQLLHA